MILVGTAGYSYDDWKGVFYPPDIDPRHMLSFYAGEFKFAEINSTYYRMPTSYMLWHMQEKTPADFEFVVKAYKGLTHERDRLGEHAAKFMEALRPLRDSCKLGCVLAQFPTSFKCSSENTAYLSNLRAELPEVEVQVEFRSREWTENTDTFDFLSRHSLGFVCVDEPQFRALCPPLVRSTSEIGYVRFHGRNYQKWWKHENAYERYDYLYSEAELKEWVPRIKELAGSTKKVYVTMNNHYQGKSVINGRMLKQLLLLDGSATL
ncbi:MAG: DUF72 domain-containing protein [Firmicutes bacterium]|nr:DUF72 domain-containing protein [Bacillota bacterium]